MQYTAIPTVLGRAVSDSPPYPLCNAVAKEIRIDYLWPLFFLFSSSSLNSSYEGNSNPSTFAAFTTHSYASSTVSALPIYCASKAKITFVS